MAYLLSITEEVADICFCKDIIASQFPAQLTDADTHVVDCVVISLAPYLVQQETVGEDLTCVVEEERKQLKFFRCKIDRFAIDIRLLPGDIKIQSPVIAIEHCFIHLE